MRSVDRNWIDHIDAMDQLRKGIGLRGYAQQDPVISYKQEGYEMFEEMIDRIQTTTISRLLKGRIVRIQQQPRQRPDVRRAPQPRQEQAGEQSAPPRPMPPQLPPELIEKARELMAKRLKEHEEAMKQQAQNAETEDSGNAEQQSKASNGGPVIGDAPEAPTDLMANIGGKQLPKVAQKNTKIGRNDPCPCGSGKKYKDCCYWKDHK